MITGSLPSCCLDVRIRTTAFIYLKGRRVLVAFHDDHIGQNRDQATGEIAAEIPVQGTQAQVTSIITEIGRTEPKVRRVTVAAHGPE